MSAAWTPVAAASEISEDEPKAVVANGEDVALYRVGDEVFATGNVCTHGMAQLSDGYLEGFLIECPLHQGLFDIRDGKCAGGPVFVDVASYDVRVVGDMVEIRLRDTA